MGNYKEKIEKYRNNEMSPKEVEDFEKELKDVKVLFDYFMESEDIVETSPEVEVNSLEDSEEKVKQKVRRRIFSLIIKISLIVLLIIGSSIFLVPRIIDNLNYNPLQGQVLSENGLKTKEKPSNFELFNRVENQIFPEEDRLVAMSLASIGAGKYSIQKEYYNDFRGDRSATKEVMNKGVIELRGSNTTNNLSLIYGNRNDIETDEQVSKDSVLNSKIAFLPDSSWVKVTLTFAKAKSWNELKAFIQQHEDITFHSLIVNSDLTTSSDIGFRLSPEANNNMDTLTTAPVPYSKEFVAKIEKDYPNLLSQITKTSTENQAKQFLSSSIQYLVDHQDDDVYHTDFLSTENSKNKRDQLKSLRDRIENDSFSFSKIQVSMPKGIFSQFVNENEFFYATLDDLSLFN